MTDSYELFSSLSRTIEIERAETASAQNIRKKLVLSLIFQDFEMG